MRAARVLVVLPLLLPVAACGDDATEEPDGGGGSSLVAPARTDGFTLTLDDGSTRRVAGPFTVQCVEDDGVTLVRVRSAYLTGSSRDRASAIVGVVPDDVGAGSRAFDLPLDEGRAENDGVFLYLGGDRYSAATESSRGTLRVVAATCDPVPRLVLEVEGTVGDEREGREPVSITGGLDVSGG